MRFPKPLIAVLLGAAVVLSPASLIAQTSSGHRPSDHTMDSTNHGYGARTGGDTSIFISPRDRELQRLDDQKRQTSDAYITNVSPNISSPATRLR